MEHLVEIDFFVFFFRQLLTYINIYLFCTYCIKYCTYCIKYYTYFLKYLLILSNIVLIVSNIVLILSNIVLIVSNIVLILSNIVLILSNIVLIVWNIVLIVSYIYIYIYIYISKWSPLFWFLFRHTFIASYCVRIKINPLKGICIIWYWMLLTDFQPEIWTMKSWIHQN